MCQRLFEANMLPQAVSDTERTKMNNLKMARIVGSPCPLCTWRGGLMVHLALVVSEHVMSPYAAVAVFRTDVTHLMFYRAHNHHRKPARSDDW